MLAPRIAPSIRAVLIRLSVWICLSKLKFTDSRGAAQLAIKNAISNNNNARFMYYFYLIQFWFGGGSRGAFFAETQEAFL